MKNGLLKKLFAITLSLAFALSLTACTPEIHTHTGDESSKETAGNLENSTIASTEESATQSNESGSKVETSVASSETQKSDIGTATQSKSNSNSSKSTSSKASSDTTISKSKAKSIALNDAGLKAADIYDYEIELDYENGVYQYEISFEYDGKDYDYDINATTGKILESEKDIDD